jgi:type I restriction enzyme M protein
MNNTTQNQEPIVLKDDELQCILTNNIKKSKSVEINLQAVIKQINEEYSFDLEDLERDFTILGENSEGKSQKGKLSLAVFETGTEHTQENIIRAIVVQDSKTKVGNKKKGIEIILDNALYSLEKCEFGLWTNGDENHFRYLTTDDYGNDDVVEISNFPTNGQSLNDLERAGSALIPANDSLIKTFKRCHDYIYGNEGRQKTAFWDLLNIIFCKIYDEKQYQKDAQEGEKSPRHKFRVKPLEFNTTEGQKAIADRIRDIFKDLKASALYSDIFTGKEEIELTDRGVAFVARELAKYAFLDATIDVKGMAYEAIVSTQLKQERGQFFTPRNIIKTMVQMLNPTENDRILDPCCGSGGFLTIALDHVRQQITKRLYPDVEGLLLQQKSNTPEVVEELKKYAGKKIFGIDFDPDLKRTARMNMIMMGDGHANIFYFNSLEYGNVKENNFPDMELFEEEVKNSVQEAEDTYMGNSAFGTFDMIFTNPPFGAKIPIGNQELLGNLNLGHRWSNDNAWGMSDKLQKSQPPEILFIEQCYNYLSEGGKLAIVLPDGILGNPNTEYVRHWILEKFKILASVDLPVEAFLPQVGVQASLLFLQKKTDDERLWSMSNQEDYEVFMAIAEKIGKDRRGNAIHVRDEDGAEITVPKTVEYVTKDKETGKMVIAKRTEQQKDLDDDLPKIAKAYQDFLNR